MMDHWTWLKSLRVNSITLTRDDHAASYLTAAQVIEDNTQGEFDETDPETLQRMRDTNTIWHLQIYPDTPIGSYSWYDSTADGVVNAARLSGVLDAYVK